MPENAGTRIRITSEESLITELEERLRAENLPILSSGTVERPGRLALDFGTVASVVTVASTLFFNGPIVPALLKLLDKHKKTRIIVDGPEKRLVIEWHSDVSEDEIRTTLRQVATL